MELFPDHVELFSLYKGSDLASSPPQAYATLPEHNSLSLSRVGRGTSRGQGSIPAQGLCNYFPYSMCGAPSQPLSWALVISEVSAGAWCSRWSLGDPVLPCRGIRGEGGSIPALWPRLLRATWVPPMVTGGPCSVATLQVQTQGPCLHGSLPRYFEGDRRSH